MTVLTNDIIQVSINGIAGVFEAKIDTGAEQTSLHAENIVHQGDNVIFELNDRIYSTQVVESQDIVSADGGQQSRPVINATLEIGEQFIETLVNLNDRGEMPQQLLIGQDVIRAGEFVLKFTEEEPEEEVEPKAEQEERVVPPDEPSPEAENVEPCEDLSCVEQLQQLQQEMVDFKEFVVYSIDKFLERVEILTQIEKGESEGKQDE